MNAWFSIGGYALMKSRLTVLFLGFTLSLSAAESLDSVLSRMDAAASGFRGVAAKLKKVTFTAIIDDTGVETGSVRLLRPSPGAVRMLIEFTEPDIKSVAFRDRKAEVFYPKMLTVQEYDLGKHRALVDQFLLLGFGTSGKALRKEYNLRVLGEETVSGTKTTRLELTPKSAQTRQHLKQVELWIADPGGYPVQQKFVQPSGDHTTIVYTDLKVNPALTENDVRLNLPKGVKREFPQK